MKRILVLGATGKLGSVLVTSLLERNYEVVALVRNPQKLSILHKQLVVIKGDITNEHDLTQGLQNIDAVISTLGHGFRTPYPVQEKTLLMLLPLMKQQHIGRFITVTGAALLCKGDPHSVIATVTEKLLAIIDPYRLGDARKQQELLENSILDWTVIRTPVHNNQSAQTISHIGIAQPSPWKTLSRQAIATFIIDCVEQNNYIRQSPIIS